MTETYTAAADAALSASVYREVIFVKIVFDDYTFLACNLTRDYVLSGDTYVGCGGIGSISVISESADVTADPVNLTLTGLNTSLATDLRDFNHQGAPVTIQVGFFDVDETIIPDPVTVFTGFVDTMAMSLDTTLSINIQADSYLRLFFRGPDGHRRMQADQEQIFVGDLGLEFAARLSNSVPWGVKTAIPPSSPPPYLNGRWHR